MKRRFRFSLMNIFILSIVLRSHFLCCSARTFDSTSSENMIDEQQMMQRHPNRVLLNEHTEYDIQHHQVSNEQLQPPGQGVHLVPIVRKKRGFSVNTMSSSFSEDGRNQMRFTKRNHEKDTRKRHSVIMKKSETPCDSSASQGRQSFLWKDRRSDVRKDGNKVERQKSSEESFYEALAPRVELEESVEYDEDAEDESVGRRFKREVGYGRNNGQGSSATAENLERNDVDRAMLDEQLESKNVMKRDAEKEAEYEDGEEQDDQPGIIDNGSVEHGEWEDREEAVAMEDKGRNKVDGRVKRDENYKVTGGKETAEREDEANNIVKGEIGKEEEIAALKREVDSVAEAKIDDSKCDESSAKRRENEKVERKEGNEGNLKQGAKVNVELKIGDNSRGDSKRDAIERIDKEMEENEKLKSETKMNGHRDNSKRALNVDTKAEPNKVEEVDASKNEVESGADEKLNRNEENESKQRENLDMEAKEEESDDDYEKQVEQQIQQKIDSIKEEIKREVEQKQKIQEIEENNAKYDELQSREDEDEEDQSLEVPSENQSVSKRSVQHEALLKTAPKRDRRQDSNREKRSEVNIDSHRSLKEPEEIGNSNPGICEKANLQHEDTRKRSIPSSSDLDKIIENPVKSPMKKRSLSRKVSLANDARNKNTKKRKVANSILIPEQAHVKVQDDLPADLTLDPSLRIGSPANEKIRIKRNPARYERRQRANGNVPDGRMTFLGYRPQDDDENDEGNEFDDDGFEDRTSNLRGRFYVDPSQVRYQEEDEIEEENPGSFLFPDRDSMVRRKRADLEDAWARRQGLKVKRSQSNRQITRGLDSEDDRNKRSIERIEGSKSGSMASLIGSSQELSPRLATEYKEAFGGLQGDPDGALARFKRVKRVVRSS